MSSTASNTYSALSKNILDSQIDESILNKVNLEKIHGENNESEKEIEVTNGMILNYLDMIESDIIDTGFKQYIQKNNHDEGYMKLLVGNGRFY